MPIANIALLLVEMAVYGSLMLGLFRARFQIGLGPFFCAIGAIHVFAVYLAMCVFLTLPFGLSASPGSVVFYTGTLSLLLMTHMVEGPDVARQPVLGLLLGTVAVVIAVAFLALEQGRAGAARAADLTVLNQMGMLMLWSTLLLFLESLVIFRLYDRLLVALRRRSLAASWLTLALVCTFDQVFFFGAVYLVYEVPLSAGVGGWIGKLVASGFYSTLIWQYRRRLDGPGLATALRRAGAPQVRLRHDPATGAFHRGRLEMLFADLLSITGATGRPVSLMVLVVDGLRARGEPQDAERADKDLRRIADALAQGLRSGDYVVRYDGDAFAILAPGLPHMAATQVAEALRQRVAALVMPPGIEVLLAIGLATAPMDGESVAKLLSVADERVYAARQLGRDRVIGAYGA
ncbi:GGDEF domain-containing protein [Roseixanthobacter glucoisosaccharinicivorans]|uniref:GGDEF domain-containing protein n=1 Tax=Roseixanthobacter glucoisosaccharinicivorans TaxID=3119923 RepID=UPI0037286ED1